MNHTYMLEIPDPSHGKDQKQKLTLAISKDVIERAKAAGVNISAVTEHLLKAITYQPNDGNTEDDVANAYDALFRAAGDILSRYSTLCDFEIGRIRLVDDPQSRQLISEKVLTYHPSLGISDGQYTRYETKNVVSALYEPDVILHNLITALLQSAEENKEKIRQLEFALRFVKVLSDDDNKKNFEQ